MKEKPAVKLALFMLLLVIWNLTEFALQANKRPIFNETLILAATLSILVPLPFVQMRARWAIVTALIGGIAHFIFGIIGVIESPFNEGFGKVGPGVAAILLIFVVLQALRELRSGVPQS
jgi:hypothetical protein